MMEQPTQFRASFNGFNREDVVRYMEYINSKHAAQVAQLTNELEYLRGKQETLDADRVSQLEGDLSTAQTENETLKQQNATLREENEMLKNESTALREEKETLKDHIAALEQQAKEKTQEPLPDAPVSGQAELEAYRRAERVERVAKERAAELTRQAAGVLDAAASQVEQSADEIDTVSAQLAELFSRLQDAVGDARRGVREAADSVQNAADEA